MLSLRLIRATQRFFCADCYATMSTMFFVTLRYADYFRFAPITFAIAGYAQPLTRIRYVTAPVFSRLRARAISARYNHYA